ncbi:MAG: phosphate ABC transporter, permease protein PstA, partial [Halomonas sp.]|nr:phosphate ABC transporter, permease protein PstA [Halomonas sp.]
FLHLDRQIMHLGFHIYDVGFQSPNVEAARPLVYATALVLVILIIVLNLAAISIRNRLREKFRAASD